MKRRALLAVAASGILESCKSAKPPDRGIDDGTLHRYHLKGFVVRIDEYARIATIRHGPITNDAGKIWMEPMTMEFPVPDVKEFAKLKAGHEVEADVLTRDSDLEFWLTAVRLAKQEPIRP